MAAEEHGDVYDYVHAGRQLSVSLAIQRGQLPHTPRGRRTRVKGTAARPVSQGRAVVAPSAPLAPLRRRPHTDRPSADAAHQSVTTIGLVAPLTARELGPAVRGPEANGLARLARHSKRVGMGGFGQCVSANQRARRLGREQDGSTGIGAGLEHRESRMQPAGFFGLQRARVTRGQGGSDDAPFRLGRSAEHFGDALQVRMPPASFCSPVRMFACPSEAAAKSPRLQSGAQHHFVEPRAARLHIACLVQDLKVVREMHDLPEPPAGPGFFISTARAVPPAGMLPPPPSPPSSVPSSPLASVSASSALSSSVLSPPVSSPSLPSMLIAGERPTTAPGFTVPWGALGSLETGAHYNAGRPGTSSAGQEQTAAFAGQEVGARGARPGVGFKPHTPRGFVRGYVSAGSPRSFGATGELGMEEMERRLRVGIVPTRQAKGMAARVRTA
eukprot:SAG11_NODE_4590_length_1840_cov_2.399196_1_plen_443_part_00